VPVIDGVNHPTDYGGGYEVVGHLRFIHRTPPGRWLSWPNSYG
jgi:hypothetical protein